MCPYSAANFGATGGTWTVPAQQRFSYMLVGKTAHIQIWIDGATVGGAPTSLNIVMPFTMLGNQSGPVYYYAAPNFGWGVYQQPSQDQYLRIYPDIFSSPFSAGASAIRLSLVVQLL